MTFTFTPEQEELQDTVRAFLRKHGRDSSVWARFTGELGVTALAIPEEHGGFGASLVEVGIVLEEAGAALFPGPYLSTVTAAAALDGGDLLSEIAAGTAVATLAVAEPGVGWTLDRLTTTARRRGDAYLVNGVKEHVLDGDVADVAVVVAVCDGEPGLFAVRDFSRTPHTTLDLTRGQATLTFDTAPALRIQPARDAAYAVDLVRAALAVESVGVARASLAMTIEYLKTREQFGVPLATFQALRHRVADLAVAVEAATSTAWYALRAAGSDEFPVLAALAKVYATDVAYGVTAESIQLHGGIGFTWEHDAHRYFKRATANRLLFGDPVTLRRTIGQLSGLA